MTKPTRKHRRVFPTVWAIIDAECRIKGISYSSTGSIVTGFTYYNEPGKEYKLVPVRKKK